MIKCNLFWCKRHPDCANRDSKSPDFELLSLVTSNTMKHIGISNRCGEFWHDHYSDVKKSAMTSQITSVSIVWSPVCSGADQRKHQSCASVAWGESTSHHWIPLTKGQQCKKCFHFMTSSWVLTNTSWDNEETYSRPILCRIFLNE